MDSRKIAVKPLIYIGLTSLNGKKMLAEFLERVERRKQHIYTSTRLFGPHPSLMEADLRVSDVYTRKIWIIRESANREMLNIDYVRYDGDKNEFFYNSYRIALTNYGWKLVNPKTVIEKYAHIPVKKDELTVQQEDDLITYLMKHKFSLAMNLSNIQIKLSNHESSVNKLRK